MLPSISIGPKFVASRSSLPAKLAVCSFVVAVFALTQFGILSWRTADAQPLIPVIHSVDPDSSNCVLRESTETGDRVLTVTGESLLIYPERALQFLDVTTGAESPRFTQGVDWRHSRRISIDMGHVHKELRQEVRLRLRVRIASLGPSPQASNWSDEFILAHDRFTCGSPRPFPPTSAIRGIEGDLWADVVIGKPDFTQIAMKSVVPFKVNNPTGVVVDRSVDPGRAYVWDSGNSRILGIDLAKCYEGDSPCSADIVIGQPSGYDHAACNGDSGVQDFPTRASPTAETLCGIPDHSLSPWEAYSFVTMAVDGDGSLYVPDSFNHRILKYESPFESDSVADEVWGQGDFSGGVCNRGELDRPTAESLCFHSYTIQFTLNRYGAGVEIDAEGNMWVADTGNNRVLRLPVNPTTGEIAKTADLVLGQSSFNVMEPGDSLSKMHAPSAVRLDSQGWLYVADAANDRVLVFEPPFESGARAARTFGSDLHHPSSLEIDPSGRGIWVVDSGNHMVELWERTGASVLNVLGKDSYEPDRRCGSALAGVAGRPSLCWIGGSIGLDGRGNVLVPVYHDTAEVLRFPTSSAEASGSRPDRRFFFPPFEDNLRDRKGIESPRGIATWRDQLIVSDIKRLMFWNGLDTLTNGRSADGVVGDEFEFGDVSSCCGRIKVDEAGRLWVLAFEGSHFLDVYQLPLTEYSVPLRTFWKGTAAFPVLGTGDEITLGRGVHGIAPVGSSEFLWVSDTDNHRVLRIRDPMADPVVDVILGQKDAGGDQCNRGLFPAAEPSEIDSGGNADVLCFPGALTIDRQGNLYVSDHALEVNGNRRLLVFSAESTPATNVETIFAPAAAKVFTESAAGPTSLWAHPFEHREVFPQHLGRFPAATWEPAFDSENRMVVGYNAYVGPRFVGVYDDPLGLDELPTSFLHDFGSMHYTATFDDDDNLYVGDINRGRVLVYRNPFDNAPQAVGQPPEDAPVPEYPASIQSVIPEPPSCIARSSTRPSEGTLDLLVHGLSERRDRTFEFRKVTSRHREFVDVRPEHIRGGSRISVERRDWRHMWGHLDRVVLTVRILTGGPGGTPITNWSPAFVLAENSAACRVQPAMEFGPPAIASVAPGDEQLAVSWTAPVEMGKGDIVAYDLRHIPAVADETVGSNWTLVEDAWSSPAGGRPEYVIRDLDADTRYDVQVRAVNAERAGPWSGIVAGATLSVCVTGGAVSDAANSGLVSDCKALLASRDTLAGTATLNWSSDTPITEWDGIRGRGGRYPALEGAPMRVARLYLHSRGLDGTIPAELGQVSELKWLYLHRNALTGEIPAGLNGLTELEWLYLYDNRLSGISDEFGAGMTGLRRLFVHRNALTGEIPTGLGSITNLDWLTLYRNQLTGEIPAELGSLTRLRRLYAHQNGLTGEIPEQLSSMSSLTHLLLHRNGLTGPIPQQLGGLSNLEWLSLYDNGLDGPIPATLGQLSSLERLYLHGNRLTGSIPAELGELAFLTNLWLNRNRLTGTIPGALGGLENLVRWRLEGNAFTGCVPGGLAAVEDNDLDMLGLVVCTDS